MHTFRFNPVFEHWVVLGSSIPREVSIRPGDLLHNGGKARFEVANFPGNQFLLDAPSRRSEAPTLHREQPALGEYELVLQRDTNPVGLWSAEDWTAWITLVRARLANGHHNPKLHHAVVEFRSRFLNTIADATYQRVGDIIMTSHAVAGATPRLSTDLVDKLREHESGYVLHDGPDGMMYAPSAPLHAHEVWYVPQDQGDALSDASSKVCKHTGEALALVVRALCSEWPKQELAVVVHTAVVQGSTQHSWWIQIFADAGQQASVQAVPLPEPFLRTLSYLLGPGQPKL
jgi:hypothetical protein